MSRGLYSKAFFWEIKYESTQVCVCGGFLGAITGKVGNRPSVITGKVFDKFI